MTQRKKMAVRGFSLIEVSVVLGMVGLVAGAIWVAAAANRTTAQQAQFGQQMQMLVQNVRNYYSTRSLPASDINATTFTATLRQAGVFPEDMCNAACVSSGTARNTFGGATTVAIPNITPTPINEIEVVNPNVPYAACIAFGSALTGLSVQNGITLFATDMVSHTTFPVTPDTLRLTCAGASPTLPINLTVRYKIKK